MTWAALFQEGVEDGTVVKQLPAMADRRDRSPQAGPNLKSGPVPENSFQLECDRVSHIVDGALFERLRWERNEGPMLAHLVALARSALEGRSEFELVEEGATRDLKRFVLKIHGNRVIAISMHIEGGQAVLQAETLERSRYRLIDAAPLTADFASVDAPWMADALQQQFRCIQVLAA